MPFQSRSGLVIPAEPVLGQNDFISWSGQLISICRIVNFERSAADLVAEVRAFLARDEISELADVTILKEALDLNPSLTTPYAQGIAEISAEREIENLKLRKFTGLILDFSAAIFFNPHR